MLRFIIQAVVTGLVSWVAGSLFGSGDRERVYK